MAVFLDDNFPYHMNKGVYFQTIAIQKDYDPESDDKYQYQIDYSKELGMYRITKFKNNHWDGDIVFDEYDEEGN